MNLSVKNVKTFQGQEGIGFTADLYLDGKKIALVRDVAQGGGYDYDPIGGSPEAYRAWREIEVKLHAYAASLPKIADEFFPEGLQPNLDMVVDDLVAAFQVEKAYKRKCKTSTIFRTPDQEVGAYYEIKRPFSAELKAHILGKHPNAEIINERYS